jgi:SAM-dependent methyltransferase
MYRAVGFGLVEARLGGLIESSVERGREPYTKVVEAKQHSPVYLMHKFWARRPHNVFSELVAHYSSPGDIVLDPFCGGGVTVVEALKLKRRAVGVDVNPLATYVTEMEVKPLDVVAFRAGYERLRAEVGGELASLYRTSCGKCGAKTAVFDWLEWVASEPTRMKYKCPECGVGEKQADAEDFFSSAKIEADFERVVSERELWYPRAVIPRGDKTDGLIKKGYTRFFHLYTKRNLLALSILCKAISECRGDSSVRDFLKFAFSSSLKWASRQSHLRGNVVEGWALHGYWIYPKTLEINVWNTFKRRCLAVERGKKFSNGIIGAYFKKAESFEDLLRGKANCLILTQSSVSLPLPDDVVDLVLTDPPFGGNVNYGELADYWIVWANKGETVDKAEEIIINRNQKKSLIDYEEGLRRVFAECFRVLKRGGSMVVTFNSRDFRVVASFIIAATRAGFVLHPQGVVYQPPIRAYTTTFHAMQVGAFTGDFVFTFRKSGRVKSAFSEEVELKDFKEQIDGMLEESIVEEVREPELREKAYRILIPFLGLHAKGNVHACREAVCYFESKMEKLKPRFSSLRKRIAEERRKMFLTDRR